jgi:hypothetical protein
MSESMRHRQIKREICAALKADGFRAETECAVGRRHTADVLADIGGAPVAVEVQCSPISVEDILDRTAWYSSRGIHVLWICGEMGWKAYPGLGPERPARWKRIIQSLQGTLFFHAGGAVLVPARHVEGRGMELGRETHMDRLRFGVGGFGFRCAAGLKGEPDEAEMEEFLEQWDLCSADGNPSEEERI